MARFLLRSSRQLYSSRSRYILQPQHVVPVRFYAKEAAPNETIKGIFLGVKNKVETSIGGVRSKMNHYAKVMTPVEGLRLIDSMRLKLFMLQIANKSYDPSKPDFEMMLMDAVEKIDKEIKKIFGGWEELDKEYMHTTLRLFFTTKWQIEGIQDTRTRLLILMDVLVEDSAKPVVEAMLMEAVDNVEEKIKKPLTVNNNKGYDLLKQEFIKIFPRLRRDMIKKDARELVRYMFF